MVEGGQEPGGRALQGAVAEHVARHVADPGHGEGLLLRVHPEVPEVVLHALPGPPGRDRHFLVVVARASSGGEGVSQPEAVLGGDAVRGVREMGRPLVRRHHEVGIVPVQADHLRRVKDPPVHAVVRQVEKPGDELPVAVDQVVVQGGAPRHLALQHEAALGSDGDDDRVLDHLGLHEAQDLGAEVVVAIAPADPAPRHLSPAQVDPLQAPRVDVDLEHGPRGGQGVHLAAVHLDREDGPLRPLIRVRAQGGLDQVVEGAQNLVLGQAPHRLQGHPHPEVGLPHRRPAVPCEGGVEAGREGLVEGRSHGSVAGQNTVHGLRVVVGADLQQVIAQRAQHLHVAPAEARQEDEAVQGIVGGPLLVQGAQGLREALVPEVQGRDAPLGRLQLEPVEEALAPLGKGDGDAQLLGHREAQVLERAQDVRQAEGADGVQVEGHRLGGPGDDADLEPALEVVEMADVIGHLLGGGGLAVEAAPRLRGDEAPEQSPPLALSELPLQGFRHPILPLGDEGEGEAADFPGVDRTFEPGRVEVEQQQGHRPAVHRAAEGDGAESLGERPPERLLRLVGVAQPGEGDVEGLVARALSDVDRDLVVPRHVDDAVDDLLEVPNPGIEQLRLGEAVEGGSDLPPGVRAGQGLALPEQPTVLLLQEGDAVGALGEGAPGETAEEKGHPAEGAVGSPLAHPQVFDGLEVVDAGAVVAEVEVDDPVVAGRRYEVALHVLHHPGKDHREQGLVGEDAGRGLVQLVEASVRGGLVADRAHEDVVVVAQPVEERPGGREVLLLGVARAQPRAQLLADPAHVLEVGHREEHALQDREDLVLDPAQPLLRLHGLDLEVAVALFAPLIVGVADPDHSLPLAARGEDGMDGGEDPQSRLLEIMLQALEDERGVDGVGLHDRGLEGQAVSGPDGSRLRLAGVAHGHMDAGEAFVELVRGGGLAGHEAEVGAYAAGQGLRGQAEGEAVRHVLEDRPREGGDQVTILGGRVAAQDVDQLGQLRRSPLWVRSEHGLSLVLSVDPGRCYPRSRRKSSPEGPQPAPATRSRRLLLEFRRSKKDNP